MFTTLSTLLILAGSIVNALPTPSPVPTGSYIQDADLLEPYATFHTRYVAWNCKNLHSTAFYDSCCHPLLKDEPVSALPTLCSSPPSVKSTITVTSTVTVTDGPLPTTSLEAVSNAAKSSDGGDCNDDGDDNGDDSVEVDDGEDCPDGTEEVQNEGTDNVEADPVTTTKAATTTTHKATTTTKAAAATPASGSGKTYTGTATYFMQNGGYGACGDKHKDSELGGAINFHLYGDSSKKSSWCGKNLVVTNTKNHKSTTIKIWDDCPSCPGGGDIDLSQGAFKAIMDDGLGEGVFPISWQLE